VSRFEFRRECRICRCHDKDRCFELRSIPHPLFPRVPVQTKTYCRWVAPDLCSFCAADGGPKELRRDNPEMYSQLVDRFGQPLMKSEYLPK
jgi:hypothetical protein